MAVTPTQPAASTTLDDVSCIRASIERPEAFHGIFERHHDRVRRYVVSRVGPQAADDVVAEVFVAAFRGRHRFDAARGASAAPWLLGVATNVIARHRHAERRWVAQCASEVPAALGEEQFDAEAVQRVDAERSHRVLARSLRRLPNREREPLLLHVFGELSYEEIAAALDVPLGTVASRINRGRGRLRTWMEQAR